MFGNYNKRLKTFLEKFLKKKFRIKKSYFYFAERFFGIIFANSDKGER